MPTLQNPLLKKAASNKTVQVFFLATLIGFVMIVPFIIKDGGYFFYYGDYNVQQVPFWQYVAELLKGGNNGWSWETDLGSSVIPSYSFYLLGSPFFWLAMLLPASWMPALMGPLMILKMSVAAVGAFWYIRRYVKSLDSAMIGALLYAFSSYTVYNIFFNHFIDVVALFPFMLLAFDKLFEEKQIGFFAMITALNLFTNYFFFIGEAVFLILYYILRVTAPDDWKFDLKRLLHGLGEAILGCTVTAVVMIPSFLQVINNTRLGNYFNGWGFFVYGETRRYLDIFQALLFPPELPHFCYFIEDGNTRWQSVAAWLPLVSLVLVIAFLAAKKSRGTWQKRILGCLFVALLMPGLGSAFYMFQSTYYSRWLFMAVLVMALVSAKVVDNWQDYDIRLGFRWNLTFTLLLLLPVAFLPVLSGGKVDRIGLYTKDWGAPIMFAFCACICVGCIVVFRVLYSKLEKTGDATAFKRSTTIALSIVICVYSLFILISGKSSSEKTVVLVDDSLNAAENFTIPTEDESEFYRIDVLDGMDNIGLYWRKSSINFFHSTVSPTIMEFYDFIGVERNVASRPSASYVGLRSLTSVKYIFEREEKTSYESLYGLEYVTTMNGYDVYKNTYFIPFGFTYDDYVLEYDAKDVSESKRDILMLHAIVLSDEQAEKYGHLLNIVTDPNRLDYNESGIFAATQKRASEACYNYARRSDGSFSTEIDLSKENLVFFSLPCEDGWTATVNGVKTDIEKVNGGLSAVLAPSGHCIIDFEYETPGYSTGWIITGISLVALAGLFVLEYLRRKRLPEPVAVCECCGECAENGEVCCTTETENTAELESGVEAENSTETESNTETAPEATEGESKTEG